MSEPTFREKYEWALLNVTTKDPLDCWPDTDEIEAMYAAAHPHDPVAACLDELGILAGGNTDRAIRKHLGPFLVSAEFKKAALAWHREGGLDEGALFDAVTAQWPGEQA